MKYQEVTVELKPGAKIEIPEDATELSFRSTNLRPNSLIYRIPVEPVIGEVVRHGVLHEGAPYSFAGMEEIATHRFTFRTVDGVGDGTYTAEPL
jgi:hypothetical protein